MKEISQEAAQELHEALKLMLEADSLKNDYSKSVREAASFRLEAKRKARAALAKVESQ